MPNIQTVSLKIDFRIITLLLLSIIVLMLGIWRPWQADSSRKINITGQSEIKAVPDEFIFYPTFQLSNPDNTKLKIELSELTNGVVAKLKELGVSDEDIELNSNAYKDYYYLYSMEGDQETGTGTATLTITTTDKALAQKIQDYLITTNATGQISPQVQFSTVRQQELESQARELAIADARAKAESSAKELDAKLGKVIEVSDADNIVFPWQYGGAAETRAADNTAQSMPILPGKDNFTFHVKVTFALR